MNTVYENSVIENQLTELMNSRLEEQSLMTVDTSLTTAAGLRKTINRYTYSGAVEVLSRGASNTSKGSISFTQAHYDVKRYQQTFEYNDLDVMEDGYMLDAAMAGAAAVMANQIKEELLAELAKISNTYVYSGDSVTYGDIVDALASLNREAESALFILMGNDGRAMIRKDPDFMTVKSGEMLHTGQFGTICGIPVVFSAKVPAGRIYISNRGAVRFFVKKEATVEQARNIETKDNTVVYDRHGVVALVDDTSSVILGKAPAEMTVTRAGASGSGANRTVDLTSSYTLRTGERFVVSLTARAPLSGDTLTEGWTTWDGESSVTAPVGSLVRLAAVDADGKCVAAGQLSV